jgi:hypothetical protein
MPIFEYRKSRGWGELGGRLQQAVQVDHIGALR